MRHAVGQAQPLQADELDFESVAVRLQLRLHRVENVLLDHAELAALGGNEIAQRMFAHAGALGGEKHFIKALLGLRGGTVGELQKKLFRIADAPADINLRHQVVVIGGLALGELALVALNALVKLIDLLDRPRQTEVRAGPGGFARRLAEGGDDGDLGLPHLEDEQQHEEHGEQYDADDDADGITIHGIKIFGW